MKIFPLFLMFAWLISNGLKAQSETELCRQIDAFYNTCHLREIIPLGNDLMKNRKTQGIKDTSIWLDAMLQWADAAKMIKIWEEAKLSLEEIHPLLKVGSLQEAKWLCQYSSIASWQGNHEKADSLCTAGLALLRILGYEHSPVYLQGLFLQGRNKSAAWLTNESNSLFEEGVQRWDRDGAGAWWQLGLFYRGLATNVNSTGNATKGILLAEKGVEILSQNCPLDFPELIVLQGILSEFYIQKREMDKAGDLLAISKRNVEISYGKQSQMYARVLKQEAMFYFEMGRFEDALSADMESAFLQRSMGVPIVVKVIADDLVADDLIELGRLDEARIIHRAILDSLLLLKRRNVHYEGHAWEGLARCETNPEKAIPLFENAVDCFRKSLNRIDCGADAYILTLLSQRYLLAGKMEEAQQTLASLNPDTSFAGPRDLIFLDYLEVKGNLHWQSKQPDIALSLWNKIVQTHQDIVATELFLSNDFQRFEQIKKLRTIANLLLTHASEMPNLNGLIEKSLDFQLFTKSLLLTTAQRIRENIQLDPIIAPVFSNWTDICEKLAWSYTQPKEDLAELKISVPALEITADSLEKIIARGSVHFASESLRKPFSWQDVRSKLRPGEAALEIARFNQYFIESTDVVRYAIFIITPERPEPAVVFIEDGDGLEQVLVEKHLLACASASSAEPGNDLYAAVWKNVEPYLKNVKTVFISADGCFHKINFASLRQPDGTYLADRYTFRPVFSLKDILNTKEQEVNEKTAFLLGNPTFSSQNDSEPAIASRTRVVTETGVDTSNYNIYSPLGTLRDLDATRGIDLKPLPGSQQEVDDLAILLQRNGWQTTLRTGTEAREEAIKALRSPAILHLATHGYFLANERSGTAGLSRETVVRNPLLRSMLFFAGSQNTLDKKPLDSREDGILTAYEVQNMNLDGTALVVLSACKTGQGKVQNGEGVYGLQRALRIAGAQSLLLSLWDVDDEVGRTFMQTFYEQWLGGKSKTDAFRATQLAIKAKHPHPFYWAGFILIGS